MALLFLPHNIPPRFDRSGSIFATICKFFRQTIIFTIFFGLTLNVIPSHAEPETTKDVSSFRIKIRRLQEGILHKESQVAESENEAKNILSELEVLDKKLSAQQEKLNTLEQKKQHQQELINKEEKALK